MKLALSAALTIVCSGQVLAGASQDVVADRIAILGLDIAVAEIRDLPPAVYFLLTEDVCWKGDIPLYGISRQ